MGAHIIDGKILAQKILDELQKTIKISKKTPILATILVGNDMASGIYIANKRKKAAEVGITSQHYQLAESTSEDELLKLIQKLNKEAIHGILVQLPLPKHIDENKIIEAIDPKKDVDGIHPLNLGMLLRSTPKTVACTPLGVMEMIRSVNYDLSGKNAVVVGRSNIVGKPMALLLLAENATVSICHALTTDLASFTKNADVLVVAVGKAKLIKKEHIKPGAMVIDVGINRDSNNQLCGDVDFLDVLDKAGYISPVPKGVGPMTIAMLLKNTWNNFLRNEA